MSDSRLRGRTRTSDIHLPPQELPDIIAALNRSGRSESRLRSRPRSRSRPRTPEAETPIRRSHRRSSDHYVSRSIRRRRSSTGMLQEQQPSYDPNYGGSITIGYLRALCKVLIEEQNRQAKEKQPSPPDNSKEYKEKRHLYPNLPSQNNDRFHSDNIPQEFDHSLPLPSDEVLGSPINHHRIVDESNGNTDGAVTNKKLEDPLLLGIMTPRESGFLEDQEYPRQRPGFKSYLERIIESQRKRKNRKTTLTINFTVDESPESIGRSEIQTKGVTDRENEDTTGFIIKDLTELEESEKTRRNSTTVNLGVVTPPDVSKEISNFTHETPEQNTLGYIQEPKSAEVEPELNNVHESQEKEVIAFEPDQFNIEQPQLKNDEHYQDDMNNKDNVEMMSPESPNTNLSLKQSLAEDRESVQMTPQFHQSFEQIDIGDLQYNDYSNSQYSPSKIVTPSNAVTDYPNQDDHAIQTDSPEGMIREQYMLGSDDLEETQRDFLEEHESRVEEAKGDEFTSTNKITPTSANEGSKKITVQKIPLSTTSHIPIRMVKDLVKTISTTSFSQNPGPPRKKKKLEQIPTTTQQTLKDLSEDFLQNIVSDLEAFAVHRKSKRIGLKDVLLFLNRVKDSEEDNCSEVENISKLAQRFLPLESLILLDNSLADSMEPKNHSSGRKKDSEKSEVKGEKSSEESIRTETRHLGGFSDSEEN